MKKLFVLIISALFVCTLAAGKAPEKVKIGLFTGGYFEYWRMFPETLEKNVTSDMERVKENFKKN